MIRAVVVLELVRLSSYCYLTDIRKLRVVDRIAVGDSVGYTVGSALKELTCLNWKLYTQQ